MIQTAIEKALSLVGQGYLYGAKGQTCSAEFRSQQAEQYPEQAEMILGTGAKWDGMPVWDCAQLTRAVAKAGGVALVSGATSQWNKTAWGRQGTIDSLPQDALAFVYRQSGGRMQHTGVSLGDGTCVHARGTAYGVVHQPLGEYAWTHWAIPVWPQKEEKNMAYVTAASGSTVRLRKAPDEKAAVLCKVPIGTQVSVLDEADGWSYIALPGGVSGWMMKAFVAEASDTVKLTLPRDTALALLEALREAEGV